MLRYERLPKKTSPRIKAGIWIVGIALAYALVVNGLIAIYGLSGFLIPYFYPNNHLVFGPSEAAYLLILGLFAALATTMLAFLGVYFDQLSKKTRPLSRVVFIPLILVTALLAMQQNDIHFHYHLGPTWIWASLLSAIVAGLFPLLFLRSPEARRLHNR